ncbi:MAG: hypothetical protein O6928_09965 [Gammaproteobacteria bacterium]|nr:hypothetical protein [Gammaproteobacteria bacterium]
MTLTGQRLLGMAAAAVPIAAYVKDIEKLDCSVILLQRILSPSNKPMKNIINTASPLGRTQLVSVICAAVCVVDMTVIHA